VKYAGAHVTARGPAPELGQHTEEVLLEAGYGWDEIAQLRESGAL
jgi:crotonobetainyl-CoA:carnitine CoA-transferase CaiB-like acyl-CoA transferase